MIIYESRVSPVENEVQDKADDDDPAIQPGNGTLKGMTSKEKVRLPHCLRYSAKVNFRDVQAWDLRLKDVLHWKSLFLRTYKCYTISGKSQFTLGALMPHSDVDMLAVQDDLVNWTKTSCQLARYFSCQNKGISLFQTHLVFPV